MSMSYLRAPAASVSIDMRIAYNPNANPAWFVSTMGILDGVTMLSIILAGAAVVREREHVLCYVCGDIMQPAGSCHACPSCGATSGCS